MPNTLVALCLNTGGLERVQSSHALEVFADVFTSRTYQRYACRLCLLKQMQDMVAPHGCVACGLCGRGSTANRPHAWVWNACCLPAAGPLLVTPESLGSDWPWPSLGCSS